MSFWPFKKKEPEVREVTIQPVDNSNIIEQDMQLLVDYFHEITREFSKIEHNAKISEVGFNNVEKLVASYKDILRRLMRHAPESHVYWTNFHNLCDDYMYEIKKTVPTSVYELHLDNRKVEEVGRISRNNTSEFIQMLSDVKKRLDRTQKREINVKWPQRSGLRG